MLRFTRDFVTNTVYFWKQILTFRYSLILIPVVVVCSALMVKVIRDVDYYNTVAKNYGFIAFICKGVFGKPLDSIPFSGNKGQNTSYVINHI